MGDVVDFIVDAVKSVFDFVSDLVGGLFNSLFGGLFEQPRSDGNTANQTVTVQQADVPRRFVFGITRLGMVAIERAKPTPESDVLYFAGVFCNGPSTTIHLYWGEELLCFSVSGQDSNGHDILIPATSPCYVVETRWGGTSKINEVTSQAALDAVGATHLGEPVMRKFKVDSSKFSGLMEVRTYDGTQTFADADMVASLPHWTTDHKLKGLTYSVFRLKRSGEIFTQGVENLSARVEGIRVIDPRDDVTRWTSNPALLWYFWKTDTVYGRAVPPVDIDIEAVKVAADICDEQVSTVYGGSEPRYSAHGVWDTGREPAEFEKDMLAAMDGVAVNLGGMETIIAGKYIEPTFEINRSHAIGQVTSQTRLPRKDQIEVVKGTYLAPDNSWKKTSFPAVKVSGDAVTDEKVVNLDLRLVSSPSQAQRLAMRTLKRAQREKRMSGTFNGEAIRAVSGKPVSIEMGERFPLSGNAALVLGWGLNASKDGKLGVQMSLRETGPEVETFNPLTDERPVSVGTKVEEDAPTVTTPTSNPKSGTLADVTFPISVTLTSPTDGASLRWSRGLNIETVADGAAYTGPISVDQGEILIARAFKDGFEPSGQMVAAFSQAKVQSVQSSLAGGEYSSGYFPDDVTLSTDTPGANIRYSLAGDVTTESDGTAYTGPVTIPSGGGTLRSRAFLDGWTKSEQTTTVYSEA